MSTTPNDLLVRQGRQSICRSMRLLSFLLLLSLLLTTACDGEQPTPARTVVRTATPTPEVGVTLITRAPPTAPVIQTTPTALPTATTTPTATPILYEVEEGDTLLGIALENFTTVDEIKTRNPAAVPELLQIGQELVLPPPATPIFQGEVNTPVPLVVTVARVATYRTPVGSLWILGEVENEGEFPATNVQVQISLAGRDGGPPLLVPAWVVPAVIPPGATAPFGVLIREAPTLNTPPTVSIVSGESLPSIGTYTLDLALSEVEDTIDEGHVAVSGQVENRSDEPVTQVTVVATFYDAQGEVNGYAQQRLDGPLAPGASLPFALDVAPPGGITVDYQLLVQGVTE